MIIPYHPELLIARGGQNSVITGGQFSVAFSIMREVMDLIAPVTEARRNRNLKQNKGKTDDGNLPLTTGSKLQLSCEFAGVSTKTGGKFMYSYRRVPERLTMPQATPNGVYDDLKEEEQKKLLGKTIRKISSKDLTERLEGIHNMIQILHKEFDFITYDFVQNFPVELNTGREISKLEEIHDLGVILAKRIGERTSFLNMIISND